MDQLTGAGQGVEFSFNESPTRVVDDEKGKLIGIEMIKTQLGEPDAGGRQRVQIIDGTKHCVSADVIIMALGFDMETVPGIKEAGVKVGQWGELQVEPGTFCPSHTKVFAGGDCQRGADLVITAAVDGRRAALGMMEMLLG